MRKTIIGIIILVFILPIFTLGQNSLILPSKIDIRVFSVSDITEISLTSLEGRYYLYSENLAQDEILNVRKFSSIKLKAVNNQILVIKNDTIVFKADNLFLTGHGFNNIVLIKPLDPDLSFRIYDDDIFITADKGKLKLINRVAIEKYIAGVVQSESGFLRHHVYYQVQATIARTYALKNIKRHENQGFNLCDNVHCQAYYGRTGYNPIIEAVNDSRGTVIVDSDSMPVNTVYHANCGGETINSEDLWPQPLAYLRSVKDTFCIASNGALWERRVNKNDFFKFIEANFKMKLSNQEKDSLISFVQDSRKLYLDINNKIHLRHIRENFKLRSTYFSIVVDNDSLVFKGKGFGHGVGLCQEGAMKMAEYGYSKNQIINFYYQGVIIIVLDDIL
jgi:stage II sporulation protein D